MFAKQWKRQAFATVTFPILALQGATSSTASAEKFCALARSSQALDRFMFGGADIVSKTVILRRTRETPDRIGREYVFVCTRTN